MHMGILLVSMIILPPQHVLWIQMHPVKYLVHTVRCNDRKIPLVLQSIFSEQALVLQGHNKCPCNISLFTEILL